MRSVFLAALVLSSLFCGTIGRSASATDLTELKSVDSFAATSTRSEHIAALTGDYVPQISFKPMGSYLTGKNGKRKFVFTPGAADVNDTEDFYKLEVARPDGTLLTKGPSEYVQAGSRIPHGKDAPVPAPDVGTDDAVLYAEPTKPVTYCWSLGTTVKSLVTPLKTNSGLRVISSTDGSVVIITGQKDC